MGDTPIVGTGREENVDRKITPRTIIAVTSLELYITRNDCVASPSVSRILIISTGH